MLSTSILGRDDPFEGKSNNKEAGFILNLIQKDKVLTVVVDETKYMKKVKSDHMKQLQQLCVKLDEHSVEELNQLQSFEDEILSYKIAFLSADDKRKASFQLAYDEDQQIVTIFEDRYRNFSDPDTPSFYYGSHYSSIGILLSQPCIVICRVVSLTAQIGSSKALTALTEIAYQIQVMSRSSFMNSFTCLTFL